MKKKSKTFVYSDCECPHCSRDVNYDVVYQRFYNLACSVAEFEIPCPYCRKPIQVFVEPVPAFTFGKAVERVNAVDGRDAPRKLYQVLDCGHTTQFIVYSETRNYCGLCNRDARIRGVAFNPARRRQFTDTDDNEGRGGDPHETAED